MGTCKNVEVSESYKVIQSEEQKKRDNYVSSTKSHLCCIFSSGIISREISKVK